MKNLPKTAIAFLVIFLVIVADQALKIWVKTNMSLYESIDVTSWFKIYFVENNGMAFGIEVLGKLFLSLFRIIAVCLIGYYIYYLIRKNVSGGYIACVSLIFAGALGNIIDSIFYGEIFTASYPGHVASLVPFGHGYSDWLHGKVVDMFYFPLIEGIFPQWLPIWGGENFIFFRPIFNLADSAITVGIIVLLLFYRKMLTSETNKSEAKG